MWQWTCVKDWRFVTGALPAGSYEVAPLALMETGLLTIFGALGAEGIDPGKPPRGEVNFQSIGAIGDTEHMHEVIHVLEKSRVSIPKRQRTGAVQDLADDWKWQIGFESRRLLRRYQALLRHFLFF